MRAGGSRVGNRGTSRIVDTDKWLKALPAAGGPLERLARVMTPKCVAAIKGDGMHRSPIGSNEAFKADLVAEDRGEAVFVAAGEGAVEAVVGAHDGGDISAANGSLKGRYIDFVQCLVVDVGVSRRSRIQHSA